MADKLEILKRYRKLKRLKSLANKSYIIGFVFCVQAVVGSALNWTAANWTLVGCISFVFFAAGIILETQSKSCPICLRGLWMPSANNPDGQNENSVVTVNYCNKCKKDYRISDFERPFKLSR